MNVFLWIVAAVLAALFLASGVMKLSRSKAQLAAVGQTWTEDFSTGAIKLIGVAEVLAAVGLLLPPALGVAPVLAPVAALGLVLLMLGAAVTHGRRKEMPPIAVNLVLITLALVVVWGRFGPHSIA
ncbi:DoxX family protein [Jiangella gansuensis]|uniref:DoxX family protein n=1 Tax=Jiangella gansuensis TaxID=281473 RepID=UPI00047E5799|nr:DoxX family protein [Jiangella gansuensis]